MKAEPAAVGAIVAAALNVVALLVLDKELSVEEQTAIVAAVTIICGLFVRSKVTPVA